MADIPKVPHIEFEAVIRSLMNTKPMPASDIPRKCELKAKKRAGNKF